MASELREDGHPGSAVVSSGVQIPGVSLHLCGSGGHLAAIRMCTALISTRGPTSLTHLSPRQPEQKRMNIGRESSGWRRPANREQKGTFYHTNT